MNHRFRLRSIALRVIAAWSISLVIHAVMFMSALRPTAVWAAEPTKSSLISKVPLREGLMIVSAFQPPTGLDHEAILTITHIDPKTVAVSLSDDEPITCPGQGSNSPNNSRFLTHRGILREDLANAHAYVQRFPLCASKPEFTPGVTGVSFSTSVLRELKTKGRTNLTVYYAGMGMVPGVLTRVESEPVPYKVIVNDVQSEIAVVHARWQSDQRDREYWILDDVSNPLVLRTSSNGKAFQEVVKLSFPTGDQAVRLERDLSGQGRTVVYGIYFDFASDHIKEESEPELKEIADVMMKNPTWRLAVEGHTDNLGGTEANLQLSQRRAAAVAKALGERYKIRSTRLEPAGFGEMKPKATNETLEGRALNRRVELVRISH